ncbi:hypothetical protein NDU88_004288 [Pleurodeles waltl]|uniref:Uncharacterized protein n=1 Tax=Pleurodeles waltl TaxID=8319 RepID=A0AAV7MT12_PLEWA|nr:hypothetical protein NDU88_004288 [Pleurodeles waltl]
MDLLLSNASREEWRDVFLHATNEREATQATRAGNRHQGRAWQPHLALRVKVLHITPGPPCAETEQEAGRDGPGPSSIKAFKKKREASWKWEQSWTGAPGMCWGSSGERREQQLVLRQ